MLEQFYSVLDMVSTAEGNWAILWRYLGLRWLASKLLARRRKVKTAGLQFYDNRATLIRERSWPELMESVKEVDACLVIGHAAMQEQQELHKVKRLLLPHPDSKSMAFYLP